MAKPTEQELNYLAGFFDAEGSVFIHNRRDVGRYSFRLHVGVYNDDLNALKPYQRYWPASFDQESRGHWYWHIQSTKAHSFLKDITPYLHLKKAEAETCMRFQETQHRGYKTPEEKTFQNQCYLRVKELRSLRNESFDFPLHDEPTPQQLQYLAGFFDGDGCVCISRKRNKEVSYGYTFDLYIVVAGKWRVIPKVYQHYWPQTYKKAKLWRWEITAHKALPFLKVISPYLRIKKDEVNTAIAFQEAKRVGGLPLSDKELAFQRQCWLDLRKKPRF